jgi:hypothetical protein
MTEQGTSEAARSWGFPPRATAEPQRGYAFGGCRDSKNVVSEDLDWSVQLVRNYKLSPFRAKLLTLSP